MDNRTFRSPSGESPQRHFGDEQMQWLLSNLQSKEHALLLVATNFLVATQSRILFRGIIASAFCIFSMS